MPGYPMNTHRALIEHINCTVTLIAAGSEEFCRDRLDEWTAGHELSPLDTPLIVAVARPGARERVDTAAAALAMMHLLLNDAETYRRLAQVGRQRQTILDLRAEHEKVSAALLTLARLYGLRGPDGAGLPVEGGG